MANELQIREQSMLADESITEEDFDNEIKDEVKEELEREWKEIAAMVRARNQSKYWDEEGTSEEAMHERIA